MLILCHPSNATIAYLKDKKMEQSHADAVNNPLKLRLITHSYQNILVYLVLFRMDSNAGHAGTEAPSSE